MYTPSPAPTHLGTLPAGFQQKLDTNLEVTLGDGPSMTDTSVTSETANKKALDKVNLISSEFDFYALGEAIRIFFFCSVGYGQLLCLLIFRNSFGPHTLLVTQSRFHFLEHLTYPQLCFCPMMFSTATLETLP